MTRHIAKSGKPRSSGNLRIGDHWNAINIIALSQSNPLKAVAELVENSIDARAKTSTASRSRNRVGSAMGPARLTCPAAQREVALC